MRFPMDRPVKVVMLGAGGTGGYVAPYLFRLLHMLDRPARFIICDGDLVEAKNLDRQNFVEADLGENKARVLSERYSAVLGMETEYVPNFIETLSELMTLIEPGEWETDGYPRRKVREMVLLLGGVDNNRTRQLCHEAFKKSLDLIYIDSGNGSYTGQVVCGVRKNGRTVRKPIGGVHPEMLKITDRFPSEVSCAEAAQADPQSIVANVTAATAMADQKANEQAIRDEDRILSWYLNLLTVYPDQPYDQPEIVHPIDGSTLVEPENCGDFSTLLPKEEAILNLVQQKVEDGERVLIYTSWTRTDSQQKLLKLLRENGYRTEILTKQIPTEKREEWVDKRVKSGLQVLITNPRCVETGLDLNAFTTIIYYSMGYNLFTLRQASRRSWRINQTAPKVEVYMFYYANTMQAKAMKLMASKLAVAAGIIEGTFSEEGLAAMSDVKDLTSQMAKELAAGIRDNVEDIAAAFKKMAIINPNRKKNVQEETNVESSSAPEVVSEPRESSVRTAQAAAIWERYEGLLASTNEEKKKRKSKVAEVDENQLSIFDFAA